MEGEKPLFVITLADAQHWAASGRRQARMGIV